MMIGAREVRRREERQATDETSGRQLAAACVTARTLKGAVAQLAVADAEQRVLRLMRRAESPFGRAWP
jgi:hypothetical protein